MCSREYSWKRGLLQHQQYSCGKEPQFCCPVIGCGYKARIKGNVKKHCKRIHPNQNIKLETHWENDTMFG